MLFIHLLNTKVLAVNYAAKEYNSYIIATEIITENQTFNHIHLNHLRDLDKKLLIGVVATCDVIKQQ